MTAAGTATGIALSGAGAAVSAFLPGMTAPLAAGLGAAAFAYSLHELGFLRLPVPGRDWQVPVEWVRDGFYRGAAIFGATAGVGVLTRVPFATLPILLAWLFISGNVAYGALAGLVYGAARALPIYASASCTEPAGMFQLNQRLQQLAPLQHQIAGIALAAFAAYLLAAPAVP